jgi:predicted TIM-barrel fold metal-dependent hydrolase
LSGAALDRRKFVTGAAAMAVVGLGKPGRAAAQTAEATKPYRIDVHHHLSPPAFISAVSASGFRDPLMTNWTPEKSLADMDKAGVEVAMLSVTTPALSTTSGEAARKLARECNEYAAKLRADHPGRFGNFAMIPLTDTDGSLQEIAYALDTLKADGIGLMTSYGDKWLGDPSFLPVMEELNRRKALVYTHPTTANCCVNLVKTQQPVMIEFGTDTTRTIVNLIFSGTSQRYKDINWIFSHGGGALTAFAERLQIQMVSTPPYKDKFTRAIVDGELNRFYYDTAQISNAVTIGALAKLVPISQIVYGTDYPYRTGLEHVKGLGAVFAGADLMAIERENALRIIPRLKTA